MSVHHGKQEHVSSTQKVASWWHKHNQDWNEEQWERRPVERVVGRQLLLGAVWGNQTLCMYTLILWTIKGNSTGFPTCSACHKTGLSRPSGEYEIVHTQPQWVSADSEDPSDCQQQTWTISVVVTEMCLREAVLDLNHHYSDNQASFTCISKPKYMIQVTENFQKLSSDLFSMAGDLLPLHLAWAWYNFPACPHMNAWLEIS